MPKISGIAVGEIKTVLDEADIQQISMRIVFVLKVQSALIPFQKTCLGSFLNMSFTRYSLDSRSALAAFRTKIKDLFSSKEHTIKLSDPQKRLEDSFLEMARTTEDNIKSIRFGFINQLSDTEIRLGNAQIKLQDAIVELANTTNEQLNIVRDENSKTHQEMVSRVKQTESELSTSILRLAQDTNDRLKKLDEQFNVQINNTEEHICTLNNRIQSILVDFSNKTNFQFESTKEYSTSQTKSFKSSVISLQDSIESAFNELGRANKHDLEVFERAVLDRFEAIQSQFVKNEAMIASLGAENDRKLSNVISEFSAQNENLHREVRSMQITMNNLTGLLLDVSSRIPSK